MNTEIIENTLLTLINEFKKDEELKTNKLNKIFSEIKTIIKEVKEQMKKYPPQFCIFDVINLQSHENYNSNLLANFLKINIKYGENTELSFVKDFLLYLHNEFKWDYGLNSIEEINHSDIRVKREEYAESRRIDLFISYKKEFAIIIENKIYAVEQDNQLEDYYNNKKKDNYKNLYMIFLTPSGYESSTLSEESKKELGNNFQTLKHSDIALWLENILENEKYYFLHEKNILFKDNDNKYIRDYRLLKSAMIQTIHNANMLSNNTKELDMTKEKIQNLLKENIFKDIQTVEDAEEYEKIFNSVNELLYEKKRKIIIDKINNIYRFTMDIVNYFIKNDIKDYYKLNYDEIVDKMLDNKNPYPHNIEFNTINDSNIILESFYHKNNNNTQFYFGIYTESEDSKIKIKKLEEKINKIFTRFEEDEYWIYLAYIDTEKDSPEEIAEAMINLYNLLKENL